MKRVSAYSALQAISGKVDGFDAADLRVLLDRAALSAARRAIDQPQLSAGQQAAGSQVSQPPANGHTEPPNGALQALAGAPYGLPPAALPVHITVLRTESAGLDSKISFMLTSLIPQTAVYSMQSVTHTPQKTRSGLDANLSPHMYCMEAS